MTIANDVGPEAQELIFGADLQIFDLKQMADMEDSYKKRARRALDNYRSWQKLYAHQSDMLARLYSALEGQMLRRQAADTCALYWVMRRDFRRALKSYLEKQGCAGTGSF